jgi:voltage-gated sodium channel
MEGMRMSGVPMSTHDAFAKQGMLYKRGSRLGDAWNPRWMTLSDSEIQYSYSQTGSLIDRIPLIEILDVIPTLDLPASMQPSLDAGTTDEQAQLESTQASLQGCPFTILTREDGSKEGRKYYFKAENEREMQDWIKRILEKRDTYTPVTYTQLQKAQMMVKSFYQSNVFQFGAAFAILINFLCNAVEAELNPEDGTAASDVLEKFDYAFVMIFTVELAINLFATFFWEFILDPWNWFDTIVVVISLISQFSAGDPGLNVLRTTRAFRVFRLFKRLKSLRQIIRAINQSLPAVCNAFFLVILMTMIYAIMGTTFIRFTDEDNFGRFTTSMYTMFRIMTFDNAAGLTWDIMQTVEGWDKFLIAIFVVSYQLIVALILCNIVMAVLLDKFSEASEASRAEDAEEEMVALAKQTSCVLDPLLEHLSAIETDSALSRRIEDIFTFVDEDASGKVDFQEIRGGFKRLETDPVMDFVEDDFDREVVQRGFADDEGEMDLPQFKTFLDVQLKEYVQKQMVKAAEDVKPDEKLTVILRSLQQIAFVTSLTQDGMDAIRKQMLKCENEMSFLQKEVDELYTQGASDGSGSDDANNIRGAKEATSHATAAQSANGHMLVTSRHEEKSRNNGVRKRVGASPLFQDSSRGIISEMQISNAISTKAAKMTGINLRPFEDEGKVIFSDANSMEQTKLDEIRGLNDRMEAMQTRLVSTIERARVYAQTRQRRSVGLVASATAPKAPLTSPL